MILTRYIQRLYAVLLPLLAAVAAAVAVSSCSTADDALEPVSPTEAVTVDLALSVSAQHNGTRLSAATTQQASSDFRGIDSWLLIPFATTTTVTASDSPLNGTIRPAFTRQGTTYNYLDQNVVDVAIGTGAYLCYGRAERTSIGSSTGIATDKFVNGSTLAKFDDPDYNGGYAPSTITFSPEPICTDESFLIDPKGVALLSYMNAIAQASVTKASTTYTWSDDPALDPALRRIFHSFTYYDETNSNYKPFAGSSTSVKALVTMVYNALNALSFGDGTWQASLKSTVLNKITEGLTIDTDYTIDATTDEITITSLGTSRDGFPASSGLPDGAAAIQWDADNDQFKLLTATTITPTTPAIFSSMEQLVYPAELWYYANSTIRTATSSKAAYYNDASWSNVLGHYSPSTVGPDTRSIAIYDPLQYGVGCVEVYVQATAVTLSDAMSTPIALTHGQGNAVDNFPLTAVLLGGQHRQQFDFTPVPAVSPNEPEGILYDPQVGYDADSGTGSISLRQDEQTTAQYPATGTCYTLSLQTRDGDDVPIILEFLNNSGEPFYGIGGVVAPGMRFYLVGTVTAPSPTGAVVVQDCKTQLVVNIASLANAYNVIPPLQTAQSGLTVVNVGIRQWTNVGTVSHPVYNW